MPSIGSPSGRPLAWWSASQLESAADKVRQALAPCVKAWLGVVVTTADKTAMLAHEVASAKAQAWQSIGSHSGGGAWIATPPDPAAQLGRLMFGSSGSAHAGIAEAIAHRAWTAMPDALRAGLGLDATNPSGQPDASLFAPWSGAVIVTLQAPFPLHVLLEAACVQALVPVRGHASASPTAPLVDMVRALATQRATLRVELHGCELDLGSLAGLRVGDVLPLPHDLEHPLILSTHEGTPVCTGYLGRHGAVKAIELAKPSDLRP